MEILVATGNAGKLAEIQAILGPAGHTLLGLEALGITLERPEDGATFAENAMIKAREACEKSGMPVLADDSGLVVDALDGAPGVHSARFAGPHGDDAANNKRLLFLLERTPYARRTARFVCVMVLLLPDGNALQAEGRCEGMIGFDASGQGGFGYDPLFYVDGRSFADRSEDEKNAISHRALALQDLMAGLPEFLGE